MSVPENGQYLSVLAELKAKISRAKIQAIQAVNERLLQLYWEIGHTILMQQESVGWGSKIIKNLASDLKMAFPDAKGFSERNLVYMQTFAATYPKWWDSPSTETNKASASQGFTITQPLVAQIFCGNRIKSELARKDLKKNKPKINPETKPTNVLIFSSMVYFGQPGFQKQTAGFGCNGRTLNALLQVKGVGHA